MADDDKNRRYLPQNKLPVHACPWCDAPLNAATHTGDGKRGPKADDMSICTTCAQAVIFNADLTVRRITAQDLAGLAPTERDELEAGQALVRGVNRRDKTPKEVLTAIVRANAARQAAEATEDAADHDPLWIIGRPGAYKPMPDKWAARLYVSKPDAVHMQPTEHMLLDDSLEALRELLPPGMKRIDPPEDAPPEVAELWV